MGLEINGSSMVATTSNVQQAAAINAPSVANIAQTIAKNSGVINLSNGVVYDVFMIPTSLSFSASSTNATGAVSTTIYAFNTNSLNAAVTSNGSGTAIRFSYGDGFTGKAYEQYARSANGGKGLDIVGFTIQATTVAGVAKPTAFSTLNLTVISANGYGAAVPVTIDLNQALRNTQYNSGMLTLGIAFYLNALTQMQMVLPVDTVVTFTLFTGASGFTV